MGNGKWEMGNGKWEMGECVASSFAEAMADKWAARREML